MLGKSCKSEFTIRTLVFPNYANIFRTTPTYQSLSGIVSVGFAEGMRLRHSIGVHIWPYMEESWVIVCCSNETIFALARPMYR